MAKKPEINESIDTQFEALALEEPTFRCECIDDAFDEFFHVVEGSPLIDPWDSDIQQCESEATKFAVLTFRHRDDSPQTQTYYFCDRCAVEWESIATRAANL